MESHREIEDHAAAWLARRDSGTWSPDDEVEFKQWVSASSARRVALLRMEVVWKETGRLKALSAGRPTLAPPPVGTLRQGPFFQPRSPGSDAPAALPLDTDRATAVARPGRFGFRCWLRRLYCWPSVLAPIPSMLRGTAIATVPLSEVLPLCPCRKAPESL